MKRISRQFIVFLLALFALSTCIYSQTSATNDKSGKAWSRIPGDPGFSVADRLAIKDVMIAYAIYWDSADLDNFLELFTKERSGRMNKERTQQRLDFFKSRKLQRRHLMANTHFLEQSESSAYIKQYALLASTKNEKEFSTVTTVVYDVLLVKENGIWKISEYKFKLDGELDVNPNAKN